MRQTRAALSAMLSRPSRSPSGSKHRANLAPDGTASCRRWARCVRLSEQAELGVLAFIRSLRYLGHTEFIEAFGFLTLGFGEHGGIEPLVDLHHGAVVGQVLVSERHPLQQFSVFRRRVELPFPQALNVAADA